MRIFDNLLLNEENENYSEFSGRNMFALVNFTTQTIFEVSIERNDLSLRDYDSYVSKGDTTYILDIDRDILISVS